MLAGLELELYIAQDEYLPDLSEIAGIRLLIHNQTYMPMLYEQGVTLAPGFATNIGITRVRNGFHEQFHGLRSGMLFVTTPRWIEVAW